PRVKTWLITGGAPPSVHVKPPSVENAYPDKPGGDWGVHAAPNGGPQKPCASLKPTTRSWPSPVDPMLVSLRPKSPFGEPCCSALARTFGPTRGGGPVPVGLVGPATIWPRSGGTVSALKNSS